MTEDDITRALAAAREDRTPPPELEAATLTTLRSRGVFGSQRRSPILVRFVQLAAIAAALLTGVWIGERLASRPTPSGTRFLLLLYVNPEYRTTDAAGDAARE